jgi:hypothetical protein
MADTLTVYEGSPSGTTEVTVATIETGKAFIMQGYWISNSNAAAQAATLKIGTDTVVIPGALIPTKDALIKNDLNIPVLAGKTIKFTAGVANDIDYYIWGITIDV